MKEILDMQVPAELEATTDDIEEIAGRDSNIWWKLKGQASITTFRIF